MPPALWASRIRINNWPLTLTILKNVSANRFKTVTIKLLCTSVWQLGAHLCAAAIVAFFLLLRRLVALLVWLSHTNEVY